LEARKQERQQRQKQKQVQRDASDNLSDVSGVSGVELSDDDLSGDKVSYPTTRGSDLSNRLHSTAASASSKQQSNLAPKKQQPQAFHLTSSKQQSGEWLNDDSGDVVIDFEEDNPLPISSVPAKKQNENTLAYASSQSQSKSNQLSMNKHIEPNIRSTVKTLTPPKHHNNTYNNYHSNNNNDGSSDIEINGDDIEMDHDQGRNSRQNETEIEVSVDLSVEIEDAPAAKAPQQQLQHQQQRPTVSAIAPANRQTQLQQEQQQQYQPPKQSIAKLEADAVDEILEVEDGASVVHEVNANGKAGPESLSKQQQQQQQQLQQQQQYIKSGQSYQQPQQQIQVQQPPPLHLQSFDQHRQQYQQYQQVQQQSTDDYEDDFSTSMIKSNPDTARSMLSSARGKHTGTGTSIQSNTNHSNNHNSTFNSNNLHNQNQNHGNYHGVGSGKKHQPNDIHNTNHPELNHQHPEQMHHHPSNNHNHNHTSTHSHHLQVPQPQQHSSHSFAHSHSHGHDGHHIGSVSPADKSRMMTSTYSDDFELDATGMDIKNGNSRMQKSHRISWNKQPENDHEHNSQSHSHSNVNHNNINHHGYGSLKRDAQVQTLKDAECQTDVSFFPFVSNHSMTMMQQMYQFPMGMYPSYPTYPQYNSPFQSMMYAGMPPNPAFMNPHPWHQMQMQNAMSPPIYQNMFGNPNIFNGFNGLPATYSAPTVPTTNVSTAAGLSAAIPTTTITTATSTSSSSTSSSSAPTTTTTMPVSNDVEADTESVTVQPASHTKIWTAPTIAGSAVPFPGVPSFSLHSNLGGSEHDHSATRVFKLQLASIVSTIQSCRRQLDDELGVNASAAAASLAHAAALTAGAAVSQPRRV
jgi:hypothetical protein